MIDMLWRQDLFDKFGKLDELDEQDMLNWLGRPNESNMSLLLNSIGKIKDPEYF